MRFLSSLVALLLIIHAAGAQENLALSQMVNAEKAFAAEASSVGIQEAFLKYLDDSAVVFEKGKISNGKEVWRNRNMRGASLVWYPEFAEVSANGDLGYTTGPAQFRAVKGSEKPDYAGYFNSIWRKSPEGRWKVVLDIGTPSPSAEYDETKTEYSLNASPAHAPVKNAHADIAALEQGFIQTSNAYTKYGSGKTRYYRPGKRVIRGDRISADTIRLQFRNAGLGMASSGDLGYAYGYVTASASEGNYLRVRKKEKNEWKIVLEVVTY